MSTGDPQNPSLWDINQELELLHQSEGFVVMNKPSGMLVHRGWGNDPVVALDLVARHIGCKAYPVHRLDRGTSGPLLFATNRDCARVLGMEFDQRRVSKRYFAFVRGITPECGSIDHPIPRQKSGPRVEAVTDFVRLATFERYSLVEAHPHTGRLHQVRRHFKHLSHPLIGDSNYGKGDHNRMHRRRFNLCRLALHCWLLRFRDPLTGEALSIAAEMPEDLAGPLSRMGIYPEVWRAHSALVLADQSRA